MTRPPRSTLQLTDGAPARVIVISGLDGSGKTTVIDALRNELQARNRHTRYVWLRYNHYLTKTVLAACRLFGLTGYEMHGKYRIGYHDFYKSRLVSWSFILSTFIDTSLASIIWIYLPMQFRDTVIVCDRWILDILVDLEVDTHVQLSPERLAYRMFAALLPSRCVVVVLKRDLELVKSARAENRLDRNFPRRSDLYERHCSAVFARTVCNDAQPVVVAQRILRLAGLFSHGA